MGKIFCLMGKSSSGKDTIYKELLSNEKLKLRRIVPYTTRPKRENETEGVEYHFVTREDKDRLLDEGKIIEIRTYETVHGPWDYFTVNDGKIDLNKGDYIMIGTIDAYEMLKEYFGIGVVLPIYIEVDDGTRLERALLREKQQEKPKYEEMCRRFLYDSKDFSKERLENAGIKEIFRNDSLVETVERVSEYIERSEVG